MRIIRDLIEVKIDEQDIEIEEYDYILRPPSDFFITNYPVRPLKYCFFCNMVDVSTFVGGMPPV